MPSRLADAQSPYLQLHAHQGVDWWPWCDEAWAEAERRGVPVFVSVGYAACHWCHVMAEETFDDAEIASFLNERFVSIKVDREERPDVDAVMMTATQAMTGSGGWPTTVFCTPAGEPFFAGTYFPPEPRPGMPSFRQVIEALAGAWADRRDEVLASGASIAEQLTALQAPPAPAKVELFAARQQVADAFDAVHGGWGTAPKFPHPMVIDALLVSGDAGELGNAQHALEAMARGGIRDQLGGGFHRYTVDNAWTVPHFEKMLTDNALLLGAYARGWRRTADHDPWLRWLFADVAEGIVGWLEREMRTEQGLFAASLDADSADIRGMSHEGIYYVWSPELLVDAVGEDDAAWAQDVFHVTAQGTFEHGLSTLLLHGHPDLERLASVEKRLLAARTQRFAPARDDKVVAAWNGWAIASLVQAAMIMGRAEWLALAREAAEALWRIHDDGERLARVSRDGVAGAPGVLEDYAGVALGFATLSAATGERDWLERALRLIDVADGLFGAEDGGWFDALDAVGLHTRPRETTDAATPSPASTMVAALRWCALLAEDPRLDERADRAAATLTGTVVRSPVAAGWALEDAMIGDEARRGLGRSTVVVVTPDGDPMDELVRAAWRMAPAGAVVLTAAEGRGFGGLVTGRTARDGRSTAYVCRGSVCFEPATDVAELRERLWRRA